ncbi:MAG TPA: hypothetical protein VF933_11520 [Streptosporangiaceae bacterium]
MAGGRDAFESSHRIRTAASPEHLSETAPISKLAGRADLRRRAFDRIGDVSPA